MPCAHLVQAVSEQHSEAMIPKPNCGDMASSLRLSAMTTRFVRPFLPTSEWLPNFDYYG